MNKSEDMDNMLLSDIINNCNTEERANYAAKKILDLKKEDLEKLKPFLHCARHNQTLHN